MTITRLLTPAVALLLLVAPGSAWAKKDKPAEQPAARPIPAATSGVSATPLTSRHLAVSWTTETATYGQVELSLTPFKGPEAEGTVFPPSFLSATSYTRVAARTHDLCPTDLRPDTVYHVRARSKDPSGAVKVSEAVNVRTLPSPQASESEFARRDWMGIYVTRQFMKNKKRAGALDASYIRGVSVSQVWSEIEPVPGRLQWGRVDEALAEAGQHGKFVKLSLLGTSKINSKQWGTGPVRIPGWVADGVEVTTERGEDDERIVKWDPVFACRWWKFVVAYGRRYDERFRGRLAIVSVSGAGSAEMTTLARVLDGYGRMGYSDRQVDAGMLWAWRNMLEVFAEAFPHARLGIVPGSIPTGGATKKTAQKDLGEDVIKAAVDTYGRRLVLVHSGIALEKHGFLINTLRTYRNRVWIGGLAEIPHKHDPDPVGTLRRLFDQVVFPEDFAFVTLHPDALGLSPDRWGNLPALKDLLTREERRFAQMREKR
jgi:hypothetical protein